MTFIFISATIIIADKNYNYDYSFFIFRGDIRYEL